MGETQFLRADASGRPVGVDRENKVIRGYVVAQEGPFKSQGRGEFDLQSLQTIQKLMAANTAGIKSRFTHPGLSSDGLGKFLGRAQSPRLDSVTVNKDGKSVTLSAVRADLHLAASAFRTPNGDLGGYVMDLAEEDSDALSSSLVLAVDEEYRIDQTGARLKSDDGEPLPPLWRPLSIHATDVVDTGDAVDGFLSAHPLSIEGLPDANVRQAWVFLDAMMAGKTRDDAAKLMAEQVEKYLGYRYGASQRRLNLAALRAKIRLRDAVAQKR